jgi:hypothetical protein
VRLVHEENLLVALAQVEGRTLLVSLSVPGFVTVAQCSGALKVSQMVGLQVVFETAGL